MMSIIVLTGMLIYEGYRLWLWSNLAPTHQILPTPVPDLGRIDIRTDYISAATTDPSATTFDTDQQWNENRITLAPDIFYRTTIPNELATVQVITNNVFTLAKEEKTTVAGPIKVSQSRSDPVPLKTDIESVFDQSDIRNTSKLSDILLLLRLHPNTTHKINIYIKKKNKDTDKKPTPFDIIFNALNSKPQYLSSDLRDVMNSIKPTYGEILNSDSTVINAENTTVKDQLKQISQSATRITIPQNTRYERKAEKKLMTNTALNTANEDTLQTMQTLNKSYKSPSYKNPTRGPRKSEGGLIQDSNYLIPYTNSQPKVHQIELRVTTDKIETKSKENTYIFPTLLAYKKNTKSNQETKTTLTQQYQRLVRHCRSKNNYALNKLVRRKMRHSRLYYTKSYYKTTEQKTTKLQTVNTIAIESSNPSSVVNESNRTSYSLKTLDIDDDEDEFSDETEVYTQYETESTTLSLKKLDIKYESNTPIYSEEDDSESVEATEETAAKISNKNETDLNARHKVIEIPKNTDETTTMNDEEDEIESGEVTEVSPETHDYSNAFIDNKNKRKTLPMTKKYVLRKHLDTEVVDDNIRHEKNHRKTRTSKPYFKPINSTKKIMKVTNYIEDESGSAETTSVSTTIADDPEETPVEGMDILFILKTRLAKPTAATTTYYSNDLLQLLASNSSNI